MTGLVEVLGGVTARRTVAAADVTASETEAKMNPGSAQPQTLFTTERVWGHRLQVNDMQTRHFVRPRKESAIVGRALISAHKMQNRCRNSATCSPWTRFEENVPARRWKVASTWVMITVAHGIDARDYSLQNDPAGRGADILGSMLVIGRRSAYDSFTIRTREESGVFLFHTQAAAPFLPPGSSGQSGGTCLQGNRARLRPWNASEN
jgi:hypothetical protein